MNIDFTCQKCEGSFELDAAELVAGSEKLECPNCNAKVVGDAADDFTAALGELLSQIGKLSKKFAVSITVESDDVEELDEDEDDDDDDSDDDDSDDDDSDDDDADDDDDDDDDDDEEEVDDDL